ncbi:DUF302 domain-containing protein [Acidianus sp. HS-5]|uniref:DUF302 domain-containing protein n=1 Tax=Acidianus sp. HS-5 TaxID=2886040 RepID=UPI001F3587CA|nr:DUF302 domain-containing protein [Acidianus sp. HS-5]BDC18673.1 hypothetical protein HS5_15630 [Acidianus sp. HS-5]
MIIKECRFNFDECEKILKNKIKEIGEIFAEIDHSKNAKNVGISLPKDKVIIFGNPKVGTLLMEQNIEVSIDLPLRVAIWEKDGKTFVEARMPSEIAREYGITHEIIKKMDEAVNYVISSVT